MAEGTALTEAELLELAHLFPKDKHLEAADYLGIERITALNIMHDLR